MKNLVKAVQIYPMKSQDLLPKLESNIMVFYKIFFILHEFTRFKILINSDDKFNKTSAKLSDRIVRFIH